MNEAISKNSEYPVDWQHAKCDKYDYMIAVFCGAAAGAIDVFFVGSPADELSRLGCLTDSAADSMVKNFAKAVGWNPRIGNEDNVGSAIGFLERNYKVNYENTSTQSVGGAFQMSAKNHHYKSLAHSPDLVGLFFSILDQFTNQASFLSDGRLIRVDTEESGFSLQGGNFLAKLFCGFCNWLGHIMSDIAGSSGSRGHGTTGRGAGLPIPFSELFLLCDFGSFQIENDRQTLAVLMTRAFQEGYDARFGAAMALPVLLEELMIRVLWIIKKRYHAKKDWKECLPSAEHADLRMMLIVGNGTLCLIDGTAAALHSGGNALVFVLHLNLVAWVRLLLLVFRELSIQYGSSIDTVALDFLSTVGFADAYALKQYYQRISTLNKQLENQYVAFVKTVEEDYKRFSAGVEYTLCSRTASPEERMQMSARIAAQHGVPADRIMHSTQELDAWMLGV